MSTLNTPILYSIPPFDARNEFTFTFAYSDNQAFENRLRITNNTTLDVVYEENYTSYRLIHPVPANKLTNGETYKAEVQVMDGNGNQSEFSAPIIFKCLTSPTFEFANIRQEQTLTATNFQVRLNYYQEQNEPLNSYQIFLYNINSVQLFTTGVLYDVSSLSYILDGFSNNTSYRIRAIGETVSGMVVDTGMVEFKIEYLTPSMFSIVELSNDELAGTVEITSNVVIAEGSYTGDDNPTFLEGEKVDLRKGDSVIFYEGYQIGENFTLQAIIESPALYVPILILGDNEIVLEVRQGKKYSANENKYFVHLTAISGVYSYVLDSEYFVYEKFQINLRRKNNLYELQVIEVTS